MALPREMLIMSFNLFIFVHASSENNRIYDGVEAETRKSQAGFQII